MERLRIDGLRLGWGNEESRDPRFRSPLLHKRPTARVNREEDRERGDQRLLAEGRRKNGGGGGRATCGPRERILIFFSFFLYLIIIITLSIIITPNSQYLISLFLRSYHITTPNPKIKNLYINWATSLK